jgi:hypothetical protein
LTQVPRLRILRCCTAHAEYRRYSWNESAHIACDSCGNANSSPSMIPWWCVGLLIIQSSRLALVYDGAISLDLYMYPWRARQRLRENRAFARLCICTPRRVSEHPEERGNTTGASLTQRPLTPFRRRWDPNPLARKGTGQSEDRCWLDRFSRDACLDRCR